jgi:hypothetical protein
VGEKKEKVQLARLWRGGNIWNAPHGGYPVRLGNGAVEVAVEVVFRGMVMGMEVTMVDPWELVVVMFPKERDDDEGLGVLLLVLPGGDDVLLGVLLSVPDWAADGVAANARAEERMMRERNRFILVRFRTANGAQRSTMS